MNYRCAVMGSPIAHSRSPDIHHAFAKAYGIALRYERIEVSKAEFAYAVRRFFQEGGRGLNITYPHKQAAFALADKPSERAILAQAANTLWMKDGLLHADITDGLGLVDALRAHLDLKDKRLLMIGAGGAAAACLGALLKEPIAQLDVMNRTLLRAHTLIERHPSSIPMQVLRLDEVQDLPYDCLIHATSAIWQQQDPLPLSASLIHANTLAYDMNYGKPSAFLDWATTHHLTALDGSAMLKAQAWHSFKIWFCDLI